MAWSKAGVRMRRKRFQSSPFAAKRLGPHALTQVHCQESRELGAEVAYVVTAVMSGDLKSGFLVETIWRATSMEEVYIAGSPNNHGSAEIVSVP